ncbi:MAG: imidazole glycerol phosphate synthase subunit HisH [Acidimicrobiales bacterium]
MSTVAIVDYGMCNLDSVRRAVEECGGRSVVVTNDPAQVAAAGHIILPGVGAFPDAMRQLRERGLDKSLYEQVVVEGAPFLGICLGMQLLAAVGFEGGPTEGLGWIDAAVRRLTPTAQDRQVPHVGWNEVVPHGDSPLFDGIEPASDFYFVHSYHVVCASEDDVAATTPYCGGFTSAVGHGNVHAVQFHPEKSQRVGLRLLRNFLDQ